MTVSDTFATNLHDKKWNSRQILFMVLRSNINKDHTDITRFYLN